MFNQEDEIELLEKTLKAIKNTNIDEMDFNSEAALIRHFEVIGGIAKELYRNGNEIVVNHKTWLKVIRTRDKLSHSYYTLNIKPLIKAISDIDELLATIPDIKRQLDK